MDEVSSSIESGKYDLASVMTSVKLVSDGEAIVEKHVFE